MYLLIQLSTDNIKLLALYIIYYFTTTRNHRKLSYYKQTITNIGITHQSNNIVVSLKSIGQVYETTARNNSRRILCNDSITNKTTYINTS